MFAVGNGRKTDPVDAHSVALVALRTPSLVTVTIDPDLQVLGMLADRREELRRAKTQTTNRLHWLLLELIVSQTASTRRSRRSTKTSPSW